MELENAKTIGSLSEVTVLVEPVSSDAVEPVAAEASDSGMTEEPMTIEPPGVEDPTGGENTALVLARVILASAGAIAGDWIPPPISPNRFPADASSTPPSANSDMIPSSEAIVVRTWVGIAEIACALSASRLKVIRPRSVSTETLAMSIASF